jgi:hypothetical protein
LLADGDVINYLIAHGLKKRLLTCLTANMAAFRAAIKRFRQTMPDIGMG